MNKCFSIYNERYVHLNGEIVDGMLHIISVVYGEEYDSEMHYELSKEETDKLFSLISLEDFIDFCKETHVRGMERLLDDNQIKYKKTCI